MNGRFESIHKAKRLATDLDVYKPIKLLLVRKSVLQPPQQLSMERPIRDDMFTSRSMFFNFVAKGSWFADECMGCVTLQ